MWIRRRVKLSEYSENVGIWYSQKINNILINKDERKNIIQFDNIRYFLNIENKTPFIKKNIKEFCEIYID